MHTEVLEAEFFVAFFELILPSGAQALGYPAGANTVLPNRRPRPLDLLQIDTSGFTANCRLSVLSAHAIEIQCTGKDYCSRPANVLATPALHSIESHNEAKSVTINVANSSMSKVMRSSFLKS